MTRAGDRFIPVSTDDIFAALRDEAYTKPVLKDEFLKADKPSRVLRRWNE